MSVTIHPARTADWPEVARNEAACSPHPWSERALMDTAATAGTRAFVARTAQGELVGHAVTRTAADEGEILTVGVHPSWRRQHIGARLLAACTRTWTGAGIQQGWLEVRATNLAAQALYVACGWVQHGVRERYYHDGEDAWIYRWEPR